MIFLGKPKYQLKDEEVLAKYRTSGKPEWLDEIFRRYSGLSYGVCLKYLKNTDDARDTVMQAFLKLQSELVRTEPRNFKSWLYVLLKNECLMRLRASGKVIQQEIPEHLPTESETDSKELDLQAMEKAMELLNEAQRICIQLFYMEGLSYKELEERTGYSPMEVKSYLQNGRRNLRLAIEKNHDNKQ
jgi:RNA polymerase sigma factor (sigma-70 family)